MGVSSKGEKITFESWMKITGINGFKNQLIPGCLPTFEQLKQTSKDKLQYVTKNLLLFSLQME